MKYFFVITAFSLGIATGANAADANFAFNSTAKLIFEKMLGRAAPEAGIGEYEVVRTGLIRCHRAPRENAAGVKYTETACFEFADNGQHPIFNKGTAVDLYEVGMKDLPEVWITDDFIEKSAKISCSRVGDEGVYKYGCRLSPIENGDEAKYLSAFRDGEYSNEHYYLNILGGKATIESIWVSGEGRTRTCVAEFELYFANQNTLHAQEITPDFSTEEEWASSEQGQRSLEFGATCNLEITFYSKTGLVDAKFPNERVRNSCAAFCKNEASLDGYKLKYKK